jgi:hypothetical protein
VRVRTAEFHFDAITKNYLYIFLASSYQRFNFGGEQGDCSVKNVTGTSIATRRLATAVSIALAAVAAQPAGAAALLADPGAGPGITTIGFELPAGTQITTQFAGSGLTVGGTEALYASSLYSAAPNMSGMTAASFKAGDNGSTTGVWDFRFGTPVNLAGAFFEFNASSTATFTALLNGVAQETYVYSNTNCCSSAQFVGFSGITFDTFRVGAVTGTDFYMDNLRFSSSGAVPEPATWAMMIGGFGLAGGAMRLSRRRKTALAAA